MSADLIPFQIETQRVIQLLAKQIYQSPLALLRENTQNAFDAIRQRLHLGKPFEARIDVRLAPDRITISDNGIGMTSDDLRQHYWTAGSSSKNNDAARAAGVVGTFGIGAMANFGIADSLTVETESAITGERTICRAEKRRLSLKEDCIEREILSSKNEPGTTVTALVAAGSHINVQQARNYIAEFVSLVDVPVFVNDELVSQRPIEEAVPPVPEAYRIEQANQQIGERFTADVVVVVSNNADLWIRLGNLIWDKNNITGRILLRTGQSTLRTFRSGFGLATASVNSIYQFGGIADLLILEPTAGREAITVDGLQFLQSMMTEIDAFTSRLLAQRDECDVSAPFMHWVSNHGRYELCGRLKMSISPGDRISLKEVSDRSKLKPMMLYEGSDQGVIKMHASEETPLLILARSNPRRRCEQNYLNKNTSVNVISDTPVIKDRRTRNQFSMGESALAFRIESILETDYFLRCEVEFGAISHNLPVLAEKRADAVRVTLNPEGQTVRLLLGLFETDFAAFGSMAKDFVRTVIFPRVADYVPSSTRQGAEAFLKAIRRPRELFEYADDDLGNLPKIWGDYNEGLISMEQAVERSKTAVRASVQVVDAAARAQDVVPDVIQNEQVLQNAAVETALNLEPSPAITRLETVTAAKLLVIADNEPALRGYRCFLAITDKVREEMGEFFLQPHRTSIVWGGQKTLFIFMHHSGRFGLYYDLQTREPVEAQAGGGPFPTATIVLKDRLFIPIPDEVRESFVPKADERKRFEVRADILRTEGTGGKLKLTRVETAGFQTRTLGTPHQLGITEKKRVTAVYHQGMTDDHSRPAATTDEHGYLLSVEEAADRYAAAGHPRTIRAIQKYCRRGDIESQKVETTYGERYLITPASIDRHIAMIIERSQASGREQPPPAASVRATETSQIRPTELTATVREQPRPDVPEFRDRYIVHLEEENTFLREQNTVLLERVKETNILTGRLQEMLTPLLAASDRPVKGPVHESGDSSSPQQG